jgi:AraC-like DNA-binding protein
MMSASIKLYRGDFGHISLLHVSSDFITHAHRDAHIIVWLEGAAGTMTIGSEVVRLGAEAAAVVNPFEPHSHTLSGYGGPGVFLAFYMDPGWIRRRHALVEGAPIFGKSIAVLTSGLRGAAMDIVETLARGGAGERIRQEIETFMDCIVDALRPSGWSSVRTGRAEDFRVRKAIELMQAHVGDRVAFDGVARRVGLSRPHFFALFKQQMKVTPNIYWNVLRMEEAVRQLEATVDPLMSVACHLGFTTQGNFSRFFRDHIGVPPNTYRSAARQAA